MPQSRQTQSPRAGSPRRGFVWRALIAVLVIVIGLDLYWLGSRPESAVTELTYSQFKQELRSGHIAKVTLQGQSLRGSFTEDYRKSEGSPAQAKFTSTRPPISDPELMTLLEQHEVTVAAESSETTWWQRMLIGLLPWLLILGVIIYFSVRMQKRMSGQGGPFRFARSQARRYREASTGVALG